MALSWICVKKTSMKLYWLFQAETMFKFMDRDAVSLEF